MNSTAIFDLALGLSSPWYVSKVEFLDSIEGTKELHIYIDFERGYKFKDKEDNLQTAYDSVDKTWQHLNFFQHCCYLHARVPRIKHKSGGINQIEVPWARSESGFTLLLEAYIMLLIESEMPVSKVTKCVKTNSPRIWRMFNYWVKRALKKDTLNEVKKIGGDKNNIELVSMDMSPAFISGVVDNLPKSQIVFDKFHLVKSLNETLDEVRKLERKGNDLLKGHKYTILRKYDNLTRDKKRELDYLLLKYPNLGEAKGYLYFWCDMAIESKIYPFQKFVTMIKSHWSGITAYFDKKVTNGVLEGINNKIQLAKRRARGYRNLQNFMNMIYFLSAKLNFDYPLYSL